MLNELKFVEGAVADKDIIPILTHFCIHDGCIQGADTRIAIETPCPALAGFSFTVPADKFIRAVLACDGDPSITITETGKVAVKQGRFKAFLPTLDASTFPRRELPPMLSPAPKNLLAVFKMLLPFISQDASRAWSLGIWIKDGLAYATNNVALVRTSFESPLKEVNIPAYFVKEIVRIGLPPLALHQDESGIAVSYADGSWVCGQVYRDGWPDVSARFSDIDASPLTKIPDGLARVLDKLLPFCPDPKYPTLRFTSEGISTLDGAHSAEMGFDGLPETAFRAEVLQLVVGVATQWDLTKYPEPIPFIGKDIEGIFVGVKV